MNMFFPKHILDSTKLKTIRKSIQANFKKYVNLSEQECVFKFFDILRQYYKFDQERFKVDIGSSWSVPVELVISPQLGIATTAPGSDYTRIASFDKILSIHTLISDCDEHSKVSLQVRVEGAKEDLYISCATLEIADNLADLVEGYCKLYVDKDTSIWNKNGNLKKSLTFLNN